MPKVKRPSLSQSIFNSVPDLEAALAELLAAGSIDDAVVAAADLLDDAIDWRTVLGGVLGAALEASDGPLLRLVARAALREVQRRLSAVA